MNPGNYWKDPIIRQKLLTAIRKSHKNKKRNKLLSESAKRRWKLYGKEHWNIASGKNHVNYNPNKFTMKRNGMNFGRGQRRRLLQEECKNCKTKEGLQLDHIKAIINGGNNDDDNAQTLCGNCNQKKRLDDIREAQQRGENGGTPIKDNPVPSWVRKSLEGVTTRGRVYRRKGSHYLKIEVQCQWCDKTILRAPCKVKRAKNIMCSHTCRIGWLNSKKRKRSATTGRFVNDGNTSTSTPPERDDIV